METLLYGMVDALTSIFAANCRNGIVTAIGAVRQLIDYMGLDPRNIMKVGIASSNLLEGYNVIYANCDFTNLVNEIAGWGTVKEWEQYFVMGSRFGALFIHDWWKYMECIDMGYEAFIGYDVGICAGSLLSLALDAIL